MTLAVIRGLDVFDVEGDRQIEQMEIECNLMAQRERIGHELHDGAIQQVYTAGLIIESVRNKLEDPVLDQRLDNAMSAMNEAIASLRSYMSNLRSGSAPWRFPNKRCVMISTPSSLNWESAIALRRQYMLCAIKFDFICRSALIDENRSFRNPSPLVCLPFPLPFALPQYKRTRTYQLVTV